MKKLFSGSLWLGWVFGVCMLGTPVLRGQVLYYPGNFDLEITFGCNCTCFCATNEDVTNTPIGGFLETNGVTGITASAVLAASVNGPPGQYVPPHWALLYPGSPDLDFEGWMQTEAVPPLAAGMHGTLTQSFALPGKNFSNPIYPYPLVPFNYFEQPMDPLPFPADSGTGLYVSQPEPFPPPIPQPYPWDINVTNTLKDGQTYVMEQQLVVGPYPPYWGQTAATTTLQTPVTYLETNSLLNISVYCLLNGSNLPVYYPTVTATLLPNPAGNIPLPFDDTHSDAPTYEILTDDLFTNWIWPLTPIDTADTSSTFAGAGGTIQAQLSLGEGPFTSIPLLVRADRAYKLTISYDLLNCGSNNDFQPMQALTIDDTGLTPPCTNMQITFYTTNCTACVNYPILGPPCQVTNTGLVDMLQTPDDPSGINVYAGPGGINPSQLSYYYAVSTDVTGAPIAALPNPAATYLLTVTASDAYANPPGVGNYSFWATEDLNMGPAYEYFQSPVAYPIDVPCGPTNNLTNLFVMCPTNPGVVLGTITLCGPEDSNYYNGVGALNYLEFASYVGGLPFDPTSDPTLQHVSSIQATGGMSLPPFDIAPFNYGYGDAVTEFDNPGIMNQPNQYVGHYSMELAGLESQPSQWSVNDVHLVFGAPVNLDYHIIETNAPYTNVDVSCGTTNINDINNCFGLLTVQVINEFYPAVSYSSISIQVSGSGPRYVIPPFNPTTYTGGTPNNASFQLFLPEGTYTVTAVATVVNSSGGIETLYPPSATYTVSCNCSAPTNTNTCCCTNCVAPYPDSYTVVVYPGYNDLADSLCLGTNDLLEDVLPNPPDGTEALFWDERTQSYATPDIFSFGSWSPGTEKLHLGEGFIIYNPGSAYTNTFYGCPPGCPPPCMPSNGWSLVGEIGLNPVTSWSGLYSCPPPCGTEILVLNPVTQQDSTYVYANNIWSPPFPTIAVGQSVWVYVNPNPGLTVICPTDKTVPCGSNWNFDMPLGYSCCDSNVTIQSLGVQTSGLCPEYFTDSWVIYDNCGNTNYCTQVVTVVNTNPPVICCPSNIVVYSCTNVPVCYMVKATNCCCTNISVECTPSSGSYFSEGVTTVCCTATDCCSNTNSCCFTVTVLCNTNECPCACSPTNFPAILNGCFDTGDLSDWTVVGNPGSVGVISKTTADGLNAPAPYFVDLGLSGQAGHNYLAYLAQSVSGFTVGQSVTLSFWYSVEYNSSYPNTASIPALGVTVTGPIGPPVVSQNYSQPAFNGTSGSTAATWVKTSLNFIANATTMVFQFTDLSSTGVDPQIDCVCLTPGPASTNTCTNGCITIYNPNNIVINSCTNAPVYYYPTATDACCSNWSVTCSPTNGSYFSEGVTTVCCTATDVCGNTNSCCFTVTVLCSSCEPEPLALFNTGVGTNGSLLAGGAVDPNYSLTINATGGGSQAYEVNPSPAAWLPNDSISQWIGPAANGGNTAGAYIYQMTFDVPCTNELTISGQWAVDNVGAIYIDSTASSPVSSIPAPTSASYSTWHSFAINGGLSQGTHTMIFVVTNTSGGNPNPTGLRVELNGTAKCCCVPAPTNLVLWLPFDELEGSTSYNIAPDPDALNGAQTGSPTPVLNAYVDNSLWFNGSDQYVTVPAYGDIDIGTNDMTLDAWVYRATNSGTSFQTILDKRANATGINYGYYFAVSNNTLFFQLNSGRVSDNYDTQPVTAGAWHFVAVTVQRNSLTGGQFYVDGVATSTFNPTAHAGSISNTAPLTVAYSPPDGRFYWTGALDEVEIFNRALTSNEIYGIYNAGGGGKCKPPCTNPPVIICPSNITALTAFCTNVIVTFTPTVIDNCCGTNDSVVCIPPSGYPFPPGLTTVTCTVTNCNGLSNSCTFNVTILCVTNRITPVNPIVITNTGGGFIILNWTNAPYVTTNEPYELLTNWELEYSTDLFHWTATNTPAAPPLILNVSNGPPQEFFRLQLQGP